MSERLGLNQITAHPVLRAKDLARPKVFSAEVNGHLRSWFKDSESNVLVIAQRGGAVGA